MAATDSLLPGDWQKDDAVISEYRWVYGDLDAVVSLAKPDADIEYETRPEPGHWAVLIGRPRAADGDIWTISAREKSKQVGSFDWLLPESIHPTRFTAATHAYELMEDFADASG